MDRLSQLRGEAGGSRDSTLDTTSPPSEAYMTANESSSKYFSLSEVESTFDISPIKDVSLASTTGDSEGTITNTEELISNLSPIGKNNDMLDSYKIGKQIEAANILSGGVNIFDENSYDGDELVIDDNVDVDDKSTTELKADGIEFKSDENIIESTLINEQADIASKDTEVVLQIDGKNVDAIDIGNGLYLYRKEGQEELAAVQIIDDDQQQPSFKFLKVRENAEGNLEVYEEIEIEVPKEVPVREAKTADKKISSHVPIKDINKVISDTGSNKVAERKNKSPKKDPKSPTTPLESETINETSPDNKTEVNLNGKMMKFSESRKSPVIGSFTPMTYHSTPNKEGIPLTKTMVDQQLHPNRHSDNIKKTIEVHTDGSKQKVTDTSTKCSDNKTNEIPSTKTAFVLDEINETKDDDIKNVFKALDKPDAEIAVKCATNDIPHAGEQDNVIDSTEINMNRDKSVSKDFPSKLIIDDKVEPTVISDDDNKMEIVEIDEADSDCLEIVTENTVTDEIRNATDGIVPSDNKNQEKVNEVINISEDVVEIAAEKKSKTENEPIASGATQSDSQNKAKVIENVDKADIILIEDFEVEEPIIKEDILETNEDIRDVLLSFEKEEMKSKGIDVTGNDEVSSAHKKEDNMVQNDTGSKLLEDKLGKKDNISIVDSGIEKEEPVSSEVCKNHELDTAKLGSDLIAKPTLANTVTEKAVEVTEHEEDKSLSVVESSEVLSVSTKVVEESVTPKTSPDQENLTESCQAITTEPVQSQESSQIEPNRVISPTQSDDKEKTNSENTSDIKPIQLTESQANMTPVKVDTDGKKEDTQEKDSTAKDDGDTLDKQTPPTRETLKEAKLDMTNQENQKEIEKQNTKAVSAENTTVKCENVTSSESNKVPKEIEPVASCSSSNINMEVRPSTSGEGSSSSTEDVRDGNSDEAKPSGNKAAVPFGKWTATNRKEFLDKIRARVPPPPSVPSTSSNQLKNTNDLNRRDVLKKIDSQRQQSSSALTKTQEGNKQTMDTAFVSKTSVINKDESDGQESKIPIKTDNVATTSKDVTVKVATEPVGAEKPAATIKPVVEPAAAIKALAKPNVPIKALAKPNVPPKITTKPAVKTAIKPDIVKVATKSNVAVKAQTKVDITIKPVTKPGVTAKPDVPVKSATKPDLTIKPATNHDVAIKQTMAPATTTNQIEITPAITVTNTSTAKKEAAHRTELNYQSIIDKTIDMLHRSPQPQAPTKTSQEKQSQNSFAETTVSGTGSAFQPYQNTNRNYQPTDQATLDAIEMKMNELHGIPFIERPPHELPQIPVNELKTYSKADKEKSAPKTTKIPNLLPFANKNQQKIVKEVIEVDSEDEVIEHEPITGDVALSKKNMASRLSLKEKVLSQANNADAAKKETIITEKDFDKFARRNSITYENCITVNFDKKEQHNVVKTVVERDPCSKSYSRNDITGVDHKSKIPYKHQNIRPTVNPPKVNKFGPNTEDSSNRNQSKFQKAYQSALTAKRQMECPITIIEDKPVKVVFMDSMEFVPTVPSQLNVQGQELSPAKKLIPDSDNLTVSTCDSLDSDTLDRDIGIEEAKSQEEVKTKTKHQRKQVLTPVEEPEIELIQPKDLGLEVSPKKKRKIDDDKFDKNIKYPMRKKYYLLGSNTDVEQKALPVSDNIQQNPLKEAVNRNDNGIAHKTAASAIDSLVKAAELLENQSENLNLTGSPNPDSQQSTPVKRGRGRPRKYPLPEGGDDKSKVPSPQKKPRLIDAKPPKRDTTTDEDDSDDEIVRENWTMGKINENIVCPICNKLFRTENVVFKHVKHCTGPSPSRSDSDKRSPRRMRQSQESDNKSQDSQSDMDLDDDKPLMAIKNTPKKRKSKDSSSTPAKPDDVIVIEDTPVKEKVEKKEKEIDDRKEHESRKPRAKLLNKNNDLVCEFCGKTFRQLSYLVSHKLQHKKDEPKKVEKEVPVPNKSVYSCEVCKKEFRKLHHLVQHRIIHNPTVPSRSFRKSSSEQSDKAEKEASIAKQSGDPSAGFRCEPCDKSFRKLHHLVEHRETHDGINRQKTTTVAQNNVEKPLSLHQCEVCKKSFRKLHHLIEHKEQHVETSSEKSDDKSVKSCLSTRDIIHECSLCYMVFPNEHSLTKHTVICQRKKRQSKQTKPPEESETVELIDESSENSKVEEKLGDVDPPKLVIGEGKEKEGPQPVAENILPKVEPVHVEEKPKEITKEKENVVESAPQPTGAVESKTTPVKREVDEKENNTVVPEKTKKVEVKETTKITETPKKKTPAKEKPASASKRLKTTASASPIVEDVKPAVESSDDDEVRYMLNPNFKVEDPTEEKVFMKVRAKKRSSLQIERPNSKDLVKRRTSLQHPPKIPRLKPKPIEPNTVTIKKVAKTPKVESVPSTDSDDSETIKYSFPKTISEKPAKPAHERTPKNKDIKTQKKILADKRKSLSGIAKRKSLGKALIVTHKSSPAKTIKKRTVEVEHRCDCGQLFSSAALLSRHTTLAHTPPRIRRRRSPPPEEKLPAKSAPKKSTLADKPKTPAARKSSARSDSSTSTNSKPIKTQKKPLDKDTKTPADGKKAKTEKPETKSSVKPRKLSAHRGVPVPEKMRKLMQKNNK